MGVWTAPSGCNGSAMALCLLKALKFQGFRLAGTAQPWVSLYPLACLKSRPTRGESQPV